MRHDLPHKVNPAAAALIQGRLHDPLMVLGAHGAPGAAVYRVFRPDAARAWLNTGAAYEPMRRVHDAGLFEWKGAAPPPRPARLRYEGQGATWDEVDAYGFEPRISDHDLYLFNEGRLTQAYLMLGAHPEERDGVAGVRFACWAPNAERVSVVGEFNHWDGRRHPMVSRGASGVWELFIPGIAAGALYKFELRGRHGGRVFAKSDPYAQATEIRPGTASRVRAGLDHAWGDVEWMERRARWDWLHAPLNIYELHAGSWRRHPDGTLYSWRELAEHLIPYVVDLGYTHLELLPVTEHPLDESWGYQTTGYFAATSRHGAPEDLKFFIDRCHQAGIGVLLDWVPAHFPRDEWALAHFDGTALYEHEDPRLGQHQDWGTLIFNYGRNEVKSFLLSSARYWLAEFHVDGLRVDAVASMLYLDYSRKAGEWLPNRYGGRENLEAIAFLQELNVMTHEQFPGALTLAEESTAWPAVSRPVHLGGLGFSMKWNMGWMNDTLAYMRHDPVYRRYHHDRLTFGQLYAYTENFVLPMSHDEVVHGKGSLLGKMPGDAWQQFANVRLLAAYQMTSPGKKLNFMGNEFAQGPEWNSGWELEWPVLGIRWHAGVQAMWRDLNRLYRELPALHDLDFSTEGFSWIDCHDADQSVISFQRRARDGSFAVVALNFTPVPRADYRIGVPRAGRYREAFNSDSAFYGGSNLGNGGGLQSIGRSWMGLPDSLQITLPPLACVILVPEG
ncbi:MAG TPA: 1,4-alpha-glucan branching protein GlgB [Burkholderiales bacterium]|nr:1,4-alpha-glucan branching protein GlgB [Burkholderiales bacterium]